MAGLYRLVLIVLFIGSAGLTIRSVAAIAANPALTPLIERSADEIVAATDRLIASEATPDRLAALMSDRLAEIPRNWIALEALAELHAERGQPLPQGYAEAWDEDSGLLARTADCARCIWDIATCSLSTALICKAPILMTPIEDVRGLGKAGIDYLLGSEVDRLDLGLSALGLSATALVVATGGTSITIKAGTATIKLARGMGRLSPRLAAMLSDGARQADTAAPILATLSDLGRTQGALGTARALHLLPLIDDASDARTLARTTEALGPRTVSRVEVLGKSRLFRATLRISGTALELVIGLAGLLVAMGAAAANLIQTLLLRALRRQRRA